MSRSSTSPRKETAVNGDAADELLEHNMHLAIDVTGTVYSIAEVGEILGWIGAAVNASKVDQTIEYRTPTCTITPTNAGGPGLPRWEARLDHTRFDLVQTRNILDTSKLLGQCWTGLFGNPSVVAGHPIPCRDEADSGMEIPLNMMAQLVNSRKVSLFGGKILIKGYSTILIPTRKTTDCIFWHLVSNQDFDFENSYMSYSDHRVAALLRHYPASLKLSDLDTSRHILGWCGEVKNLTGKRDHENIPGGIRLHVC